MGIHETDFRMLRGQFAHNHRVSFIGPQLVMNLNGRPASPIEFDRLWIASRVYGKREVSQDEMNAISLADFYQVAVGCGVVALQRGQEPGWSGTKRRSHAASVTREFDPVLKISQKFDRARLVLRRRAAMGPRQRPVEQV